MKNILFVCAGNRIRSPAAQAIFKKMAQASGKHFNVESAGVFAKGAGEAADSRIIESAKKRGYAVQTVARKLKQTDFYMADVMYTMDATVHKHVTEMAPRNSMFKTAMVLPMDSKDVPDPYKGTSADFDAVMLQIESACAAILKGE